MHKGAITIACPWPGKKGKTDYTLGRHWYSDRQEPALFWNGQQGAQTSRKWRNEIMEDWGKRWAWLK